MEDAKVDRFYSSICVTLTMKAFVNQSEIQRQARLGLYATFDAIRQVLSLSREKY